LISEKKSQVAIFGLLLLSMLAYLFLGILLPSLAYFVEYEIEDGDGDTSKTCESLSPIPSFTFYIIFMVISFLIESSIYGTMKLSLEGKQSECNLEMNSYFFAKWF
jgi:hypothetical protein